MSAPELGASCSFCSHKIDEVTLVIAGLTAVICEDCVDLCGRIVAEKRAKSPRSIFTPDQEARIREILREETARISAAGDRLFMRLADPEGAAPLTLAGEQSASLELAVKCLEQAALALGRISPPIPHQVAAELLAPHRELVTRLATGGQS